MQLQRQAQGEGAPVTRLMEGVRSREVQAKPAMALGQERRMLRQKDLPVLDSEGSDLLY